MALLRKMFRFLWLKVTNMLNLFFKKDFLGSINELFKSNQNCCACPTMYIDFKIENCLAVACLEKISEYRWLIVANKRIIFFKYSLFQCQEIVQIKQKLVCESHHVCRCQKRKLFSCSLPRKRFRISLV